MRVNSGGTVLSYSDLPLSMATNQWSELDAREEVRTLVTELNSGSREFACTKDNVLKAGLVLTEVPDVGFKVSTFTRNNMAELEKQWGGVKTALRVAVKLLASFGFTPRTLTASTVLIPSPTTSTSGSSARPTSPHRPWRPCGTWRCSSPASAAGRTGHWPTSTTSRRSSPPCPARGNGG